MAARLLPATLHGGFGASRKCPEQLEKVSELPESVSQRCMEVSGFPESILHHAGRFCPHFHATAGEDTAFPLHNNYGIFKKRKQLLRITTAFFVWSRRESNPRPNTG